MSESIFSKIEEAFGFDELWNILIEELNKHGISSVAYGSGLSSQLLQQESTKYHFHNVKPLAELPGVMDLEFIPGFIRTNHPVSFMELFTPHTTLMDDYAAVHNMVSEELLFWHHREKWQERMNESQKKFRLAAEKSGFAVGVSVPYRFSKYGVSGFGMNSELSHSDFEENWQQHGEHIVAVGKAFDQATRKRPENSYYQLKDDQKELLKSFMVHGNPKQAFEYTKTSESNDKNPHRAFERIRKTLGVDQNVHAVIKAVEYNLI